MVYRRSSRAALRLRPVTSNKEVLDTTLLAVSGGTNTVVELANGVQNYTGVQFECPVGARISSIYLFVQVNSNFQAANVDWYFAKRRGGQDRALEFPTPGATGGSSVRNQIYHEEKGIPGDSSDTTPLTFRGVLRIPKRYQRMREQDGLFLKIRGSLDYNVCVKCIYKWFI